MTKKKIIQSNQVKQKPKQSKSSMMLMDNPTSLKVTVRKIAKGYIYLVQDWFGCTMAQGTRRTWEETSKAASKAKRQLRADALAKIEAAKKKWAEEGGKESTIFSQQKIAFGKKFDQ